MIMANSTDLVVIGGARACGIRFVFADVTDSARELARSHLAGPAAAEALAEGLVAVAILGADLAQPEETVSLYMKTEGPIESLLVEASFEGALRGFTGKKILGDFDGEADPNMNAVFGASGDVHIMRSLPGRVLSQSGLQQRNPRPVSAASMYFSMAAQRPVEIASCVLPGADGPDLARGFLVELLPDGDKTVFNRVVSELRQRPFSDSLEAASGAQALCAELGLGDVVADPPRPQRFSCRCSRQKALDTLRSLSAEEREAMKKQGRSIDIFCHMCGKCHTFQPGELDFE